MQPLKQSLEELEIEAETYTILTAIEAGQIIGSVRAYERDGTCYIGKLIVKPVYQNQGIGTKLMIEIEKMFLNAARFELFTGKLSIKNIRLYEKMKYHIFKEERGMDTIMVVFMQKE
ncbi:MAG: GNAT family N-acetyltransferase [Vallitaleaceae bacterium]|nr:GNAT family N-acetyltransferase [Vallitaleaceae bacterium]